MKLLVTGGAGFIGSNFIHYFLEKHPDTSILNLDKLTYAGNLDHLAEVESQPNYTFIKGDICDAGQVESLLDGTVDAIVHELLSFAGGSGGWLNYSRMADTPEDSPESEKRAFACSNGWGERKDRSFFLAADLPLSIAPG